MVGLTHLDTHLRRFHTDFLGDQPANRFVRLASLRRRVHLDLQAITQQPAETSPLCSGDSLDPQPRHGNTRGGIGMVFNSLSHD